TLLFALAAWLIMQYGGRVSRKLPAVLIAVVITTLASWALGFEQKTTVPLERVEAPAFVESVTRYAEQRGRIDELTSRLSDLGTELRESQRLHTAEAMVSIANDKAQIALLTQQIRELKQINNALRIRLHAERLAIEDDQGVARFVPLDTAAGSTPWRFAGISDGEVTLSAGGAVVGTIPEGLPKLRAPTLQWDLMLALLPAALVMALIGFMEATSISKAIAASTGERVDTSKELVGQGLANIAGSFFGSYTVSGSFSRSAVAARTGATTGLFAIISALGVMLVLLFFTPYLYHLPQAVLAVIVMTAVFGLIRTKPLWHAFRVEWPEAAIGVMTFFATLIMAPSLASGILLGVGLTVLWYLIQIMRPRAEIVARKTDGTLGGIRAHRLEPISKAFVPVRFDGSLSFINVAYFEDILLEAHADFPRAEAILIIGSGINQIDVSGEEKIRELTQRLKELGITLMFSGLKHQVMTIFERGGLIELIGRENFFSDKETALQTLIERYGANSVAAEPKPA
ncbi:MAG: SulP family inorganic anion transporter, partial [Chromatiales bacterium]